MADRSAGMAEAGSSDQPARDSLWTVDTAAGSMRALLGSMLRALPRTPAVRFFAPKTKLTLGEGGLLGELRDGRLQLRLGFTAVSIVASSLMFKAHHTLVAQGESVTTPPANEGGLILINLFGGVMGGAINGLLMCFSPRPDVDQSCASATLRGRVRAIPTSVVRESTGFGLFFAIHAYLYERWRPLPAPAPARDSGGALLSDDHLASLGTSCAAGAMAGACYHAATFPISRAQAFAAPETTTAAVLHAARSHGIHGLYAGVLRTSVPGLLVGAATFGVYDSALQWVEGGKNR